MWEKIKVDRMTLLLPSELNKLNYPNLLNKLNNPYAIHLFNQLILFTIQGLTPKSLLPVRVIPCVSVAIKVIQTGSTGSPGYKGLRPLEERKRMIITADGRR